MQHLTQQIVLILLSLASIVLVAFQQKPLGIILLFACACLLIACDRSFSKHVGLLLISLTLLGITSIDTDTDTSPAVAMAATLSMAILLPYFVSRYIYKDGLIQFSWHHGRGWYKKEIAYIAVAGAIAYLVLPYYLVSTGAYMNWPNPQDTEGIIRLFIGTNALGIWDELFFVCVALSLLRPYLPFWQANIVQATMWAAFLYELGFISWAFIVIFLFALLQGYIFKRTQSLLYIITIHLTVDLVLFLALLNAHDPSRLLIFIT